MAQIHASRARRRFAAIALSALAAWLCASTASAVLLGTEDGSANTSSPFGFFGWDYAGEVNGLSATYLGEGWVLTANHVGAGDLVLESGVYPWVPGTEVRLETSPGMDADLLMFQVSPEPPLGLLPLRETEPQIGELAVLIGCGRDRGPSTGFDPNGPWPPGYLPGWSWAATRSKRWGTNEIGGFTALPIAGTVSLYTSFEPGQSMDESQAVNGDSGGPLFTITAEGAHLSGIIIAIGGAPGQPAGTSLVTNQTFAARIDFYREQIEQVMALPEPRAGWSWGAVLLVALARRRAQARGAGQRASMAAAVA